MTEENGKTEINLGGRPRKEVDFDVVKRLCIFHCTKNEICDVLDIDEKTLTLRIQEKFGIGFSEYFKKASSEGKTSLRRKQFEIALKGSIPMLIWLGKQVLDQKDRQEVEQTGTILFGSANREQLIEACEQATELKKLEDQRKQLTESSNE